MIKSNGQVMIPPGDISSVLIENDFGKVIEILNGKRKRYQSLRNVRATWVSAKINGELIRFDEQVGGTCMADYGVEMAAQYAELAAEVGMKEIPKPTKRVNKIETKMLNGIPVPF